LQNHPAVIGACVVGVPDKKVGERIKAIVILKEDARGVGAHELNAFCRERLAAYKIPQYIEFRDMLPKSKVEKLVRFWAKVYAPASYLKAMRIFL